MTTGIGTIWGGSGRTWMLPPVPRLSSHCFPRMRDEVRSPSTRAACLPGLGGLLGPGRRPRAPCHGETEATQTMVPQRGGACVGLFPEWPCRSRTELSHGPLSSTRVSMVLSRCSSGSAGDLKSNLVTSLAPFPGLACTELHWEAQGSVPSSHPPTRSHLCSVPGASTLGMWMRPHGLRRGFLTVLELSSPRSRCLQTCGSQMAEAAESPWGLTE